MWCRCSKAHATPSTTATSHVSVCCAIAAPRPPPSDNNLPFRDTNGFRKLIVVLTAPGKLFGLHSGDGRILWASTDAAADLTSSSSDGSSDGSSSSKQYLRLWRRFHDLTHAPQVVVLTAAAAEGAAGGSAALVVNAHTGQQLQHEQLPYAIEKVGEVVRMWLGVSAPCLA